MAVWLDRMITRVRGADSLEAARAVAKDFIDPTTGERKDDPLDDDNGDTHIHLHMNGKNGNGGSDMTDADPDIGGGGDPSDPSSTGGGPPDLTTLAAQVAALTQRIAALESNDEEDVELESPDTQDSRRFKLRRGRKLTKDEDDPVPERNPDMIGETDLPFIEDLDERPRNQDRATYRRRSRDSADMEETWNETLAAAEIIVPNFRMPTFDASIPATRTAERLCSFRRRVMDHAMDKADTADIIAEVVGIRTKDGFKHLSCDSVKMAFNSVAGVVRTNVNGRNVRRSVGDGAPQRVSATGGAPSIREMNETAKQFWASQKH